MLGRVRRAHAILVIAITTGSAVMTGMAWIRSTGNAEPSAFTEVPYDLGPTKAWGDVGELQGVTRLEGLLVVPRSAEGPVPLVVLLHGMPGPMCAGAEGPDDGCLPPTDPGSLDMYLGLRYLARDLARNGFAAVLIDADPLNMDRGDSDSGIVDRVELLFETLERLAKDGPALPVRLDFSRVGLLGHSRGGEAAVVAAALAAKVHPPLFTVRGVFAVAPTDYMRVTASDVPLFVLLSYCDGDTFPLVGRPIFTRARYADPADEEPKFMAMLVGANHYFYNDRLEIDDAAISPRLRDDSFCGAASGASHFGTGRWTADDQRLMFAELVQSFFRAHLSGERSAGAWLRLVADVPGGFCPADRPHCSVDVLRSYQPPSSARLVLDDAGSIDRVATNLLGGTVETHGPLDLEFCAVPCTFHANSNTPRLRLEWSGPSDYRTMIPAGHRDVSGFDSVVIRLAVNPFIPLNPQGLDQDFEVGLIDVDGHAAWIRASSWGDLRFPPGGSEQVERAVLRDLRVPLSAFYGVDTTRVAAASLRFGLTPTGALLVSDIMFAASANDLG